MKSNDSTSMCSWQIESIKNKKVNYMINGSARTGNAKVYLSDNDLEEKAVFLTTVVEAITGVLHKIDNQFL